MKARDRLTHDRLSCTDTQHRKSDTSLLVLSNVFCALVLLPYDLYPVLPWDCVKRLVKLAVVQQVLTVPKPYKCHMQGGDDHPASGNYWDIRRYGRLNPHGMQLVRVL